MNLHQYAETHQVTNQPPSLDGVNLYRIDRPLQHWSQHFGAGWAQGRIDQYGALAGGPLMAAGFLADVDVTRVVLSGQHFGQPYAGNVRLQAQSRNAGEGHGQRAAAAGFGLAVQVGHRRTRHMGARLGMGPRQRRQAMLDGGAHQLVISRVKLNQVNAMAITVMAAEHRFVLVGQEAGCHQRPTRQRAVGINARLGPAGAKAA